MELQQIWWKKANSRTNVCASLLFLLNPMPMIEQFFALDCAGVCVCVRACVYTAMSLYILYVHE